MEKETPTDWSENESEIFRTLSRYAVPERERQIAIITRLVAASPPNGAILDLCCGEGELTAALLGAFPRARILAYDGSESMLDATAKRTGGSSRLELREINLRSKAWRRFEVPLRAAISSLAVHHLEHLEKRQLFEDLNAALIPGGVFALADVIRPATKTGDEIAADLWDEEVRRRAMMLDGNENGFQHFQAADWNHFRHRELDPIDKPATIAEHLEWLREAGFVDIDVHWMTAGQAIISAWKKEGR